MKHYSSFLAPLLLLFSTLAYAQSSHPTLGIVHNQSEHNAITYDCGMKQDGKMDCTFVQVRVRKKLPSSEIATKRAQVYEEFLKLTTALNGGSEDKKKDASSSCAYMLQVKDIAEGRSADAVAKSKLSKLSADDRRGMLEFSKLYLNMCNATDSVSVQKSVKAMTDFTVDAEASTCIASATSFKQTFTAQQSNSKSPVWVVQDSPSGACGIVRLDKFEFNGGTDSYRTWTYTSRKAITNPNSLLMGEKCSKLDEAVYIYNSLDEAKQHNCKVVEFGVM